MLYSIYKRLGLVKVKPITIKLQLEDISYIFPKGEVENVLAKVNKFILLIDFVALDMEEYMDVPIIMDIHSLTTSNTITNEAARELFMTLFNESMVIKIFELSEYLDAIMACLEEGQCGDLKCGTCFTLMMARRKKK